MNSRSPLIDQINLLHEEKEHQKIIALIKRQPPSPLGELLAIREDVGDELPQNVDMVWLSYKEDCFYRLKTAIDYEKVAKLFREGFNQRVLNGEVRHKTYDTIVVGIAPGGVVVLWVGYGYLPLTEIGRYQAEKIKLREPEGLDNHQKLIFDKEYAKRLLTNNTIIPEDFREANKNKPIPFGLWDSYRDNQYQWYPTFEIPNGKMGDVHYQYWNGEGSFFFFTDFMSLEEHKDVGPRVGVQPA